MDASLDLVLKHPGIWRGDHLAQMADETLPTGYAELDEQLPGGGWARGALTEILLEREGIGELRLLLPALARISAQSEMASLGISTPCAVCAGIECCRSQPETTSGSAAANGSRRLVDCGTGVAFRRMQCRAGMAEHARRAAHAPPATRGGIRACLGRIVPFRECRAGTFHSRTAAAPGSNIEWTCCTYPQTPGRACEQTRDGESASNKWLRHARPTEMAMSVVKLSKEASLRVGHL